MKVQTTTDSWRARRSFMTKSGFTLIELLIVIAIIGILAAILFPVFARARENARRSSCMSNVRQIGIGMMQYVQDFDERYPPLVRANFWGGTYETAPCDASAPCAKFLVGDGLNNGHWITWMDMIFPYVKSSQLFVCPSFAGTVTPSYGYNREINNNLAPLALADVKRPAEIIMAVDYNFATYFYANSLEYTGNVPATAQFHQAVFPHFDGGNICFADGHVKWMLAGAGPSSADASVRARYWTPTLE